jgi:hypothetical protein
MPALEAPVLHLRHCRRCGRPFAICCSCDHGYRYGSRACSQAARREQCREAKRRHQRTPHGRVRIPTKPATHSDGSRPPCRSVATRRAHGWSRWPPSTPAAATDSVILPSPVLELVVAAVGACGNPGRVVGGRPGFPRGVGRFGGGWAVARSFPYPGSFHSRGGGPAGGWGLQARQRAAIAS